MKRTSCSSRPSWASKSFLVILFAGSGWRSEQRMIRLFSVPHCGLPALRRDREGYRQLQVCYVPRRLRDVRWYAPLSFLVAARRDILLSR